MSIKGQVVLVTGAGSGIGRAMAQAFSAADAIVVAVDRDPSRAEATVALLDESDHRSFARGADVTDADAVDQLAEELGVRFGTVHVLCNNAGIFDAFKPAHETSRELWDSVMAVNVTGPFLCSKAVIPLMLRHGSGVIINTASISSVVAGGGGAAYTTSKHAVLGLTRQLALDYGQRGIRVNAICPGAIATEMSAPMRADPDRNPRLKAAVAGSPAGRWGEPSEIANLALFLASDDSAFIHGSAVMIDGGWTIV